MDMKPLDDRVLVRRDESATKSAGGIFIPDAAQKPSQEGEVVAVGAGRLLDNGKITKMRVKVGDRVLFNKGGAISVNDGNEELALMSERTIYAIVG